jgi:NAD(P)-dependent dehydrogenase (short-subunit alcohol dehydrogenase family)
MDLKLRNKLALVTGSAKGIGLAIATGMSGPSLALDASLFRGNNQAQ